MYLIDVTVCNIEGPPSNKNGGVLVNKVIQQDGTESDKTGELKGSVKLVFWANKTHRAVRIQ